MAVVSIAGVAAGTFSSPRQARGEHCSGRLIAYAVCRRCKMSIPTLIWKRLKQADNSCDGGVASALSNLDQNSSGALSTTSFITKNVRVCRTPGNAINWSP